MGDFVKAIPLSIFDSASVSGTYQAINAGGLPNACFEIILSNSSNKDIFYSWDGITNVGYVRANSDQPLNSQTNSQPNNYKSLSPKGRVYYIKGTAGTGTIALSGYYI